MTTMMKNVEKFEDQSFDRAKQLEKPVLRFTGDMSERMARFVPERPSFMADMPKMGDVVESQLKFGKRFVDEQVRFTRRVMKAMDPLMVKIDHVPEQPARKVPKTKATKATKTVKAA